MTELLDRCQADWLPGSLPVWMDDYPANCLQPNCLLGGHMTKTIGHCVHKMPLLCIYIYIKFFLLLYIASLYALLMSFFVKQKKIMFYEVNRDRDTIVSVLPKC